MIYLFNKFSLILIFTFSSFLVFGQNIKGTIKTNSIRGQVEVYFTSDFTNSTDFFDGITLTFAITDGTSQATANTVASLVSSDIPSITGTAWAQTNTIVNSERIYTFVGSSGTSTAKAFTSGTEFRIATFLFNDNTMNPVSVKLANFTGGATGGQSYLYASLAATGELTTQATKFYAGSGGVTGSYGTSTFVKTSTNVVLPVTLVSFTAAKAGTGVNLNWLVSSETNAKGYDVERSSGNGAEFTLIGHAEANNSGKYSSTDTSPLSGVNYYRLKMIDIDGKFKYSEVRTVLFDGTTSLFDIFPNPVVTNTLYLHLQQHNYAGKAQAILTDIAGRNIQSTNINIIKGNNQLPITVKGLNSGTYFVTIYDAKGNVITETKKLVKQ